MEKERNTESQVLAPEAAGYDQWLAAEIREAIDDPRPGVPHAEVMARMQMQMQMLASSRPAPARRVKPRRVAEVPGSGGFVAV